MLQQFPSNLFFEVFKNITPFFKIKQLQTNLVFLAQIFKKCSACYRNLINLWCGYTCTPSQGIIVQDTQIDNSTGTPYVTGTSCAVNPAAAQSLYDSCIWIETNGVLIKDLYKTYQDFFNFMGTSNPVQTIKFVFTETDSCKKKNQ